MAQNILDNLKLYINPQFYKAEKDAEDSGGYVQKNAVFEEQSRVGRATGKLVSPKIVQDALNLLKEDEQNYNKKERRKRIIVTADEHGNLKEEIEEDFYPDDDLGVLG